MTPLQLDDLSLWQTKPYLNGAFCDSGSGDAFPVINPSTEKPIASVSDCTVRDVETATASAAAAFPSWRATNPKTRGSIVRKLADLLISNASDLGKIMTTENGKPFLEAKGEIMLSASYLHFYAGEAERQYGEIIPSSSNPTNRVFAMQQPVGVVACLTPWNFPAAMVTRKAGAAIAAGCTVVLKPAEETPLTALAIAVLSERAGFPRGVLNILTCSSKQITEVGKAICENNTIRKLSFTGSTAVGKLLMQQCAGSLKKLSLELGGNSPFIVFDDCNFEAALDMVMGAKMRNTGQTCVCANRIFVQRSIYDAFTQALVKRFRALKVGDGFVDGVVVGPLTTARGVAKIRAHIEDATRKGAKVLFGGNAMQRDEGSGQGYFFEPSIVGNMTPQMLSYSEEIFGPVAALYPFDTEEEVLEMANNSNVGLGSYVCSNNNARIWRMAENLDVGIVGVNTGVIAGGEIPFGGVKHSGFGTEGGKWGLKEFQITKGVIMAVPDIETGKARM